MDVVRGWTSFILIAKINSRFLRRCVPIYSSVCYMDYCYIQWILRDDANSSNCCRGFNRKNQYIKHVYFYGQLFVFLEFCDIITKIERMATVKGIQICQVKN